MSAAAPGPRIVHLMRHGEPVPTERMLGRTDSDVTAAGIAACAAQAADLTTSAILSSDLQRAARCADAIAGQGGAVRRDPCWRELDFGHWDGLAAEDVDPDALARFWQDPDAFPPPGGERWSSLTSRVGHALAACDDATLVVTHAGAIRAALAVACGLTVAQTWTFDLPYAAMLTLRCWPGEPMAAQIVRLRP